MSLDVMTFIENNFDIKPVHTVSGEYRISPCPNCGNSKMKLYVNVEQEVFHCFVCDYGRGEKITRLFHDVGVDPLDYIAEDSYIPDPRPPKLIDLPEKMLPLEYRTLLGNNSIGARQALSYLRNRGLSDDLIVSFKIGYCYDGKYKNRVIIPYYEKGELAYFVARDITDSSSLKYHNPDWEKHKILFNYERARRYEFVLIVEGVFDVLAAPNHSVCLLGKHISSEQANLLKRFKKLYFLMDGDAIDNAYKLCMELFKTSDVFRNRLYVVTLPNKKDPFDMRNQIHSIVQTAELYTGEEHNKFTLNTVAGVFQEKDASKRADIMTKKVFKDDSLNHILGGIF